MAVAGSAELTDMRHEDGMTLETARTAAMLNAALEIATGRTAGGGGSHDDGDSFRGADSSLLVEGLAELRRISNATKTAPQTHPVTQQISKGSSASDSVSSDKRRTRKQVLGQIFNPYQDRHVEDEDQAGDDVGSGLLLGASTALGPLQAQAPPLRKLPVASLSSSSSTTTDPVSPRAVTKKTGNASSRGGGFPAKKSSNLSGPSKKMGIGSWGSKSKRGRLDTSNAPPEVAEHDFAQTSVEAGLLSIPNTRKTSSRSAAYNDTQPRQPNSSRNQPTRSTSAFHLSRGDSFSQEEQQQPFAMSAHAGHVQDADEDDNCPVCLESLSLRLAGEKPHIVPVCGHKLHEACFEAVYGSVERAKARPGSLGLCGVCRRDMKLGDAEHGPGKSKFAALTGLPGSNPMDSHKVHSISKRTLPSEITGGEATHDPADDDDVAHGEVPGHAHKRSGDTLHPHYGHSAARSSGMPSSASMHHVRSEDVPKGHVLAQPTVTIRAEHSSVLRQAEKDKKSNLTCLVTVEMPTRLQHLKQNNHLPTLANSAASIHSSSSTAHLSAPAPPPGQHMYESSSSSAQHSPDQRSMRASSPGPQSAQEPLGYSFSTTNAPDPNDQFNSPTTNHEPDAFDSIVRDLQSRMADWKGHSPDDFGRLHMFDLLSVRKEKKAREFYIYLFTEALLCVADEGRSASSAGKGLGSKVMDGLSGNHQQSGGSDNKLRLKGRVYVRHMASARDTSAYAPDGTAREYSLTISMDDENLDNFVILFPDAAQMNRWRNKIESLASRHQSGDSELQHQSPNSSNQHHRSHRDSVFSGETEQTHSSYATDATRSSKYTRTTVSSAPYSSKEMAPVSEEPALENMPPYNAPAFPASPLPAEPSEKRLPPIRLPHDFPAIDLMLIFSVPLPTSAPSSYQLKIRLIRSTLDFVISNVGPRSRVSIVAFSAGEGARGMLCKTPLLSVNKPQSRERLNTFIDSLGSDNVEGANAFDRTDESVNVVTAVNLALDVVLQRKAKSSLTGMLLMNDSRDSTQKHQMDLVMARAEAAAVSIHAIGWGRAHDPASLWLLSNYTSGTYTFVKDLYGLRDAVAGCIGGMLSVVATNFKLFLSIAERRWFRIRKVSGVSGAIVSADGGEVDITLGEMRLGEKREMLIEVEMGLNANSGGGGGSGSLRSGTNRMFQDQLGQQQSSGSTATDDFLRQMGGGLNGLSLDDDGCGSDDFFDESYNNSLVDDVPVFEAQASFRDPILSKNVSRLSRPSLLLITVLPPLSENEKPPVQVSDVNVVRRRVELLVSDMMTRCLLLMSRRNPQQAQRLMTETRRIIATIYNNVTQQPPTSDRLLAEATLTACIHEVEALLEGIVTQREQFETNHRNFAGQNAVSLRDQRSWTGRSPVERLFWSFDHSQWMARRSADWTS